MATLTIADLDNGKRDLETVDAVANSNADFTTTRFGSNVLTLAGALRRLGYRAPVPYASGLNVESALFTVSRDGVIYAPDPLLVPFTTGAWNVAQWRPVQNTNDTSLVYRFLTLGAAQTAAALLPDGASIIVDGISQGSVSSGVYVPESGAPAKVFQDYAALEAYSGPASFFQISTPGIAGLFGVIPGDTTTPSNGGTVLVLSDGRRVRRLFTGPIDVRWFGAKADGVSDDAPAINAAILAAFEGGEVLFSVDPVTNTGTYAIASTVNFEYISQSLRGASYGGEYGRPMLKWIGPQGGLMCKAANGKHFPTLENLVFEGNKLADVCLFIEALAGSATMNPSLRRITFQGYRTRGLVLGENDDTTLKNGQMGIVFAEDLQWRGGGAANALGVLVNSQNVEWVQGDGWYFDPTPGAYENHLSHIKCVSGGLKLSGLLTTRANSYAVDTNDNFAIEGWRAEDRYLLRQNAVDNRAPSTLTSVVQRYDPAYLSTDNTISHQGISQPLVINGATLQGSILIGAVDDRSFVGMGLSFPWGGQVVFAGPSNASGVYGNTPLGQFTVRGSGPSFRALSRNGAVVAELGRRTQFGYAVLPVGASPIVTGGTVLATNNAAATTISLLTGLELGQIVILIGNDGGLTTIANGSAIKLTGGSSIVLNNQDTITFVGGVSGEALEISRSKK